MPNYLSAISGYFQGVWDDCKAGADVFCAPEEFVPNSGDGTSNTLLTQAQIDSASNTAHLFSAQNIVDQLEGEGISWKAYMENLPSPGSEVPSLSTSGETLTIEESMTLRARTENAGHAGDEHERSWSWSSG
jgi:hypothetical protein